MKIDIFYSDVSESKNRFACPIEFLTERFKSYRFWDDKLRFLTGRLLLSQALKLKGFGKNKLEKIEYNNFKKPFIKNCFSFNISHSKDFVILAVAKAGYIGCDIEYTNPKNKINEFNSILHPEEIDFIRYSQDSIKDFHKIWCRKEALLKAQGSGFFAELQTISVLQDQITLDNTNYEIRSLDLHRDYACAVAFNFEYNQIKKQKIKISDLLSNFYF